MENILVNIREELKQNSDVKIQESSLRFFKEEIRTYGIKSDTVRKIAKENFKAVKDKNKSEIFALCEELWKSGFIEESFIACDWAYSVRKDFKPEDFKVFERWVRLYVSNWASCDTLCNHTVGAFVEMYPKTLAELKNWAKSDNRWVKRASAVSLIIPARKGKFLSEILEIADTLLLDPDDLVRKGYGWMLKAASEAHEKEIFNYILKNKSAMPRTALRYAIEKMPVELKQKAMAKEGLTN